MGMRPDQIAIGIDTRAAGSAPATVIVTEPLGGDMLVDVELAGTRMLVKTEPISRGPMGAPCWVAFDVSRWHCSRGQTGVAYF